MFEPLLLFFCHLESREKDLGLLLDFSASVLLNPCCGARVGFLAVAEISSEALHNSPLILSFYLASLSPKFSRSILSSIAISSWVGRPFSPSISVVPFFFLEGKQEREPDPYNFSVHLVPWFLRGVFQWGMSS